MGIYPQHVRLITQIVPGEIIVTPRPGEIRSSPSAKGSSRSPPTASRSSPTWPSAPRTSTRPGWRRRGSAPRRGCSEKMSDEESPWPSTPRSPGRWRSCRFAGGAGLGTARHSARSIASAAPSRRASLSVGAPILSGLGIQNVNNIRIIREFARVPVIVDGGASVQPRGLRRRTPSSARQERVSPLDPACEGSRLRRQAAAMSSTMLPSTCPVLNRAKTSLMSSSVA